jgi:two-component system response regulator HydG
VRELKNCIERAFILGDTDARAGAADSERRARITERRSRRATRALDIRVGSRIYDMERSLIEATLDYFKGNKRRAADALGCSLKTLYNKLNGYSQSQECANS